jgi:lycopene cyclase domain-containing protein
MGEDEAVRFAYVGVLAFILVGTLWLEVFLRTRVFRRWLRLVLSLVPVAVIFCLWDLYAIASGHWDFDVARITGIYLPGNLPIDEVLFFLVVPLAGILALEGVRSATRGRAGWEAGDEANSEGDAP